MKSRKKTEKNESTLGRCTGSLLVFYMALTPFLCHSLSVFTVKVNKHFTQGFALIWYVIKYLNIMTNFFNQTYQYIYIIVLKFRDRTLRYAKEKVWKLVDIVEYQYKLTKDP